MHVHATMDRNRSRHTKRVTNMNHCENRWGSKAYDVKCCEEIMQQKLNMKAYKRLKSCLNVLAMFISNGGRGFNHPL